MEALEGFPLWAQIASSIGILLVSVAAGAYGYFRKVVRPADPSPTVSLAGAIVDNRAIAPLVTVLDRIAGALERHVLLQEARDMAAKEAEKEHELEERILERLRRDRDEHDD